MSSSSLPGNPHAEQLEGYLDPRNSLEMMATLALAHEQRTANLIALYGDGNLGLTSAHEFTARQTARALVLARLGLLQEPKVDAHDALLRSVLDAK